MEINLIKYKIKVKNQPVDGEWCLGEQNDERLFLQPDLCLNLPLLGMHYKAIQPGTNSTQGLLPALSNLTQWALTSLFLKHWILSQSFKFWGLKNKDWFPQNVSFPCISQHVDGQISILIISILVSGHKENAKLKKLMIRPWEDNEPQAEIGLQINI